MKVERKKRFSLVNRRAHKWEPGSPTNTQRNLLVAKRREGM
jgi:hypothetical protein